MRHLFLIFFIAVSAQLSAQTEPLPPSAQTEASEGSAKEKLRTNLYMGSQFSSYQKGGNAFSSYVMPDFSYGLTSRFSVFAGFGIINTQYNNLMPLYPYETKATGNFTTGIIYGGGRYLLNDRVTLSGSAYKMFDISGQYPYSPYSNQRNPQGFNFSVDYRITDGFHIQAGFGYHENVNPYYNMGGGTFGNDPLWSPFGTFPVR